MAPQAAAQEMSSVTPQRMEQIAAQHGVPVARVADLYRKSTAQRYGYMDMATDPNTGQTTHYQTKDGKWLEASKSGVRDVKHPGTGKSVGLSIDGKFIDNKTLRNWKVGK